MAVGDKALLIQGASGTGKSTLALQLMAYGAALVSDDQTLLGATETGVTARAPDPLKGLIEARGVGILQANAQDTARLTHVIDMDHIETDRIPPRREVTILSHVFPLLHKVDGIHLAPAILQWMRAGRSER